ncbi:putative alpha-N-acetylglucosaminidase [Phyllosticta citriasiana]|uniref:Alpha-N-acetylglucosaminidase n=1 Tax=Phyllosticta citriasiana TaxID=595635 RepID=A0ABR1L054_9PEZI
MPCNMVLIVCDLDTIFFFFFFILLYSLSPPPDTVRPDLTGQRRPPNFRPISIPRLASTTPDPAYRHTATQAGAAQVSTLLQIRARVPHDRLAVAAAIVLTATGTTQGLVDLVTRRIPDHAADFQFVLSNQTTNSSGYDHYAVSTPANGQVKIESSSLSGLANGLHRYLADVVHVDIYWFIGSRLHLAPTRLPRVNGTLTGSALVPWGYHFNRVTFSYTSAFWTWEDWELELDWLALRGVNLPLAWTFLSGPAFQSWNRFGNIQGSWGCDPPTSWIDCQFELQKKIVERMVELGMTPVLPSFTGFVPRAISRVLPNATIVNGSQWNGFAPEYTNVTFLKPFDEAFTTLQKRFIEKQARAYGNVSHIYTLDQYNENDPYSGDLDYLRNVTYNTWKAFKAADADAIWMMQGWLFYSNSDFWTDQRVEAYLSGVEEDNDMLILDLFSESQPRWQRTNSYYGKPWIWCQLHDYGGNIGLYGQVENITINPVEALANSSTLVGFGLTMEGQEGNEIIYDLLLDQAWSSTQIDTTTYFSNWVSSRYADNSSIPSELYAAWDMLRSTVYNNTALTTNVVTKSIFELQPALYGLTNRTGHHATTITYSPDSLVQVWLLFYAATAASPTLWANPAFQYDMVDVTRQVLINKFDALYTDFVDARNATTCLKGKADTMTSLLETLDDVLSTNENFSLAHTSSSSLALLTYNARNQPTLWRPRGEISDYASKPWAGLVSTYYVPRWRIFFEHVMNATEVGVFDEGAMEDELDAFEQGWQWDGSSGLERRGDKRTLREVVEGVRREWGGVLGV